MAPWRIRRPTSWYFRRHSLMTQNGDLQRLAIPGLVGSLAILWRGAVIEPQGEGAAVQNDVVLRGAGRRIRLRTCVGGTWRDDPEEMHC
jgi:hypothetical protein